MKQIKYHGNYILLQNTEIYKGACSEIEGPKYPKAASGTWKHNNFVFIKTSEIHMFPVIKKVVKKVRVTRLNYLVYETSQLFPGNYVVPINCLFH